jgi:hypothetical protein
MAKRHWLDPLARQLLIATGQIPPPPRPERLQAAPRTPALAPHASHDEQVERELMALKLQQDPRLALRDAREVALAAALGWRLDVNRATAADWQRLPGMAGPQVDLLMRLQACGVQLSGPEDLHRALDWPPEQIGAWLPVLEFRWYGEPPSRLEDPPRTDLNRATAAQLGALGLSTTQTELLKRERARQPFSDLADLQQRLQLPIPLVEGWIGRVEFGTGRRGPVLPPARRP